MVMADDIINEPTISDDSDDINQITPALEKVREEVNNIMQLAEQAVAAGTVTDPQLQEIRQAKADAEAAAP